MEDDHPQAEELESREPSLDDLVALCQSLNRRGDRYIVIGGFAVRAAGYDRRTVAVDLLVEATLENEAKVASPSLLLRMKRGSVRAKDLADVEFLEQLEADKGP